MLDAIIKHFRSNDDAITAANNTPMENVVPIFCISSGT